MDGAHLTMMMGSGWYMDPGDTVVVNLKLWLSNYQEVMFLSLQERIKWC